MSSTAMKSYLSLIPISAKVRRRQNRMTILCIVLAVFLVTAVFSMADMAIRMETSNQLNKNGNWHIMVKDISPETAAELAAQEDVAAFSAYSDINASLTENYFAGDKRAALVGADDAIAHGPESHAPILMSDPIGMLWVAECVWHGDDASYLVILGPVFDAAASLQTLQNCLRGMNLSVSLTATIMEKLEQVPILPLSTLHQYIKMLHWVLYEETLDVGSIRLQNRSNIIPDKEESPSPWDPDRARVVEAQIMQRIREGDIYYPDNSKGMGRFADKDSYNLGNPLRESKDTAIIFTALCARAAMEGGLSPRIAKQLEVQYIRAIEQCTDVGLIEVNSAMVSDFVHRVHDCRMNPALSDAVQEICAYVHSHLTDNILLDDIAAAVGYTSYYLTKKFYRETGQRMTDYINHAKIQYACVQLTGTDKTLQQISEELHYSSRSYFTAVFRKVIGCSPTEYRNNGGNKP